MKPRPIIHRTTIVRIHGSPGEAISLDEYLESERDGITAAHLRELSGFSSQIFAKLASEQARQHHDLHAGTSRLMQVIAPDKVGEYSDPLPVHLAEAGVALSYLLKGVDLIPDSIPEIGLTDDARVVARVIARHPEFQT